MERNLRRAFSLRRFFTASAFALALLPVLLVVVLSERILFAFLKRDIAASVGSVSRSVALEVSRYLDAPARALSSLDAFLAAGPGDAMIQAFMDSELGARPELVSVILLDEEGRVLLSSPEDRRAPGQDYSGQPSFKEAKTAKGVILSPPYVSPADGSVTIAAYGRAGRGFGAVTLKLEALSDFLSSLRLSPLDRIGIADGAGRFAAHTDMAFVREQRYWPGRPAEGKPVVEDGRSWIAATADIGPWGWHVAYYRDEREARRVLRELGSRFAASIAAAALLAAILGWRLKGAFEKPFARLLAGMESIAGGDYSGRLELKEVEEFGLVAGAFNAMMEGVERRDARIKADLGEKVILLKEVHHRVKNNLQIMASLMNLASRSIKDPEDSLVFKASQDRVHSMALVHELLYQSEDLSSIDMADYVKSLVFYLRDAYPSPRLGLKVEVEPLELPLEKALPCGLLLNELLTNSLKYATGGPGDPLIEVRLRSGDATGRVVLEVGDRGPGLPSGAPTGKEESLGLSLVESLSKQLEGELSFSPAALGEDPPGLRARLEFPR